MMPTTKSVGRRARFGSAVLAVAYGAALLTAAVTAHAASADETRLLAALRKAHPGTHFTEAARTEISGVYEVWMNGNVAYVASANPRYFVFGRLFDTQTMRDITGPKIAQRGGQAQAQAQAQTETAPAATVAFEQLPLADAIKTVRGNGQRKLAVFSDPNCVYCKQLEPELAGLDNVTVYTFLVPFQGEARPIAIWCAADRERAWHLWMLQGDASQLQTGAYCDHPVGRNLELARKLGVQGTPTLVWADGTRTSGYVERSVLEARLADAAKSAKVTSVTAAKTTAQPAAKPTTSEKQP